MEETSFAPDPTDLEEINKAIAASENTTHTPPNPDHGWQKVSYPKRQRRTQSSKPTDSTTTAVIGGAGPTKSNVFRSVEQQAEDRRRRNLEAQKAAMEAANAAIPRSTKPQNSDDDDDSDADVAAPVANGGGGDVKKPKVKKPKKPKVSVAEAASKIDASDLAAFLVDISASFETQQDIQLMRFADYFARAFSSVGAAQFPWTKIFKESPVAKLSNIPLNDVSEDVYKTSVDWISGRSSEVLGSFILWALDTILAEMASQQGPAKGSKKGSQQGPSKAQVAIFVVMAMVLRRKPDTLISLLPILREDKKYQGQDKLPVFVWVIAQACQGDLAVGMLSWVQNLLPTINSKSCNPQSRDLILQLLERILCAPKARVILLNGAVRKGERLVPPSALEMLMIATFPVSSARVKATERFEAAYPILKELALAGAPGSKAMKQVTQQIFSFAVKAAGEGNPELSKEATSICIWCLTQNPECYKHWDKIYLDNLDASAIVLKKLSEEWKEHRAKHSSLDSVKDALKSFRQKNEKALSDGEDTAHQASIRSADKYCKTMLGKLSGGHGCAKAVVFAVVAAAVGVFVMSPPDLECWDWDWNKISVMFSSS